jgi:hypothetical protein
LPRPAIPVTMQVVGHANKVLALTKRTATLCAAQRLLYAAGFDLITATNIPAAMAMMRSMNVRGLILCHHSWTETERASISAGLLQSQLPTMNCPGCTGCNETCGRAGTLNDQVPLNNLIKQIRKPTTIS